MSTASISRARWKARFRRLRGRRFDLLVAAVVVFVVTVAVYHGIRDGSLTWALPIIIAVLILTIVFHEAAHALVAWMCGDDTAKRQGRLSLNPRRHVDPVGTLIVPTAMILLGGPGFGWARPTPVALNRLHHPRNQSVLVALAGPFANAIIAAAAGVGLHFILASDSNYTPFVATSVVLHTIYGPLNLVAWIALVVGFIGLMNLFIGLFNLIPIPPLDGASLLERFLPVSAMETYHKIRTGFFVVLLVLLWLDRSFMSTIYFDIADWYMKLVLPSGSF